MGCGVARSDLAIDDGKYVYVTVCHYEPAGNVASGSKQWEEKVPPFVEGKIGS